MISRRGFHLIELIVVMAILPVVMIITGKLFLIFSQQMPQSDRTIGQHTTIQHFLDQLEEDMSNATDVSITKANNTTHLIIHTPETTWRYNRQGKNLQRHPFNPAKQPQTWRLPQGFIQWELVQPQQKSQALLIQTSIKYTKGKRQNNKLAQSRLYFYPNPPEAEVQP